MQTLLRFNNSQAKHDVLAYIHDFIDKEALRRVYSGEGVESVKDARALIDSVFDQLEFEYGNKQKKPEITDEAI